MHIEPKSRPQSTQVGVYMAQLDGMKSRCSETAMMTKRSAHMPMFTRMETTKSTTRLRRIEGNQKICGASTLQKSCMYQMGA